MTRIHISAFQIMIESLGLLLIVTRGVFDFFVIQNSSRVGRLHDLFTCRKIT